MGLFTERTGATVNFDTGPGGERLNKLLTQEQSTEIDVFVNTWDSDSKLSMQT